jgi:hypothetical protein
VLSDRVLPRLARVPGVRSLWSRFPVGQLSTRIRYGISARPMYAYGVYRAASMAKQLGLGSITAIEFGVAGGRGLLALEDIADEVARDLNIEISVLGFDSATGMPGATDYRDLPYVWEKGFYQMDEALLRSKLRHARLVLGNVAETIPRFLDDAGVPPIGFVAFDLDYYSSTRDAFGIFGGKPESRLPRTWCSFDDIMWPETACHNEFVGELCAIREYNEQHEKLKLCPIHMLAHMQPIPAAWHKQIYVHHDFLHPLYCVNLTPHTVQYTQKPL